MSTCRASSSPRLVTVTASAGPPTSRPTTTGVSAARCSSSRSRIAPTCQVRLRGAGLSNAKLLALRDLAHRSARGSIPTLAEVQQLDDETVVQRLTEVRGIGRWTVEMLLMFRLGRPDVLPVDDYGVRQGFAIAYRKRKLPPPKALAKYGARWAPYRTTASWYLWRAVDLSKRRD